VGKVCGIAIRDGKRKHDAVCGFRGKPHARHTMCLVLLHHVPRQVSTAAASGARRGRRAIQPALTVKHDAAAGITGGGIVHASRIVHR